MIGTCPVDLPISSESTAIMKRNGLRPDLEGKIQLGRCCTTNRQAIMIETYIFFPPSRSEWPRLEIEIIQKCHKISLYREHGL